MSIMLLFHVHITGFLFYLSLNLFTCSSGGFILVHSSNESNTLDSRNFSHRISEGKTTSCKDRLLKAEVDLLPLQKNSIHQVCVCFDFLGSIDFLAFLSFLTYSAINFLLSVAHCFSTDIFLLSLTTSIFLHEKLPVQGH